MWSTGHLSEISHKLEFQLNWRKTTGTTFVPQMDCPTVLCFTKWPFACIPSVSFWYFMKSSLVKKYHYVPAWFWVGQYHLEGCGCGGRGCMDFLQSEATTSTPPSSAQLQQSFKTCNVLGSRLPGSTSISIHLMKIEAHTKSFQVPCSRIKSQGGSLAWTARYRDNSRRPQRWSLISLWWEEESR